MVSRGQIAKLESRLDQLIEARDPPLRLVVFQGESTEQAKRRHLQLCPEHAGKRMKLEQRPEPRTDLTEMLAVCTMDEIRAAVDAATDQDGRLPGNENKATVWVTTP